MYLTLKLSSHDRTSTCFKHIRWIEPVQSCDNSNEAKFKRNVSLCQFDMVLWAKCKTCKNTVTSMVVG